jgi:hypothetical protein
LRLGAALPTSAFAILPRCIAHLCYREGDAVRIVNRMVAQAESRPFPWNRRQRYHQRYPNTPVHLIDFLYP